MSYYYKYNFVSPEPIFAVIKEELRTYFEAGAVDDAMFSTWMDRALKKLGRSTNKILETVLFQKDFESKLPATYKAVREAWLCMPLFEGRSEFPRIIQSANSNYEQVFCKVTPEYDACDPCLDCLPEIIRVTYKSNITGPVQEDLRFRRIRLLRPGNIESRDNNDFPLHTNPSSPDTYDVRGNKFVTNLREGVVHLLYYAEDRDGEDYQLVPDNYWIQEYVKRFIKYKIFEQLWNQTTDETFNQVKQKMDYYKTSYDEGWIMADTETKKRDAEAVRQAIVRDAHRLDSYIIDRRRYW